MPTDSLYQRDTQLARMETSGPFDLVVIGGGATGAGIAVDAAVRGFRVALCEQHDFGKGTSSRSTKLIHGGVRYLQQGNIKLVREALHERGLLRRNAQHLVYRLPTIVPLYSRWQVPYYWLGLKAYDLLAGELGIGRSQYLSASRTRNALPTVRTAGLRGGIRYFDAGFDDARLLVNLVQTAVDHGAACANYLAVEEIKHNAGRAVGVAARDVETGRTLDIDARVVVNAAGPQSDQVRHLDNSAAERRIAPSQGAHLVLSRAFLPGDSALIVPKTPDGRVIFAIPWQGHTLVGTTDSPCDGVPLEPVPLATEIDFLLETVAGYLERRPQRSDILSVFAGIRPLVAAGEQAKTSKLGRDHQVQVDDSGLISVLGGKWTTYRRMAADCVDRAIEVGDLQRVECGTATLAIHGSGEAAVGGQLAAYGTDAAAIAEFTQHQPEHAARLDSQLPHTEAEVLWSIRHEMARTVEDVMSRRQRILPVNVAAALRAAPRVAQLLADELGRDNGWVTAEVARFETLAQGYLVR